MDLSARLRRLFVGRLHRRACGRKIKRRLYFPPINPIHTRPVQRLQ
jgi:hypothetical protein